MTFTDFSETKTIDLTHDRKENKEFNLYDAGGEYLATGKGLG